MGVQDRVSIAAMIGRRRQGTVCVCLHGLIIAIASLRGLSLPPIDAFVLQSNSGISMPIDSGRLPDEVYSRHPHLAERISFVRPADEWLASYLSLSESDQEVLYSRWPSGLDYIKRVGRRRLHEWLAFFLAGILDHSQMRKMIISRPQLLSYKLQNIKSTTSYFCDDLGLSSDEFASLLQAYPSVLMYSIDARLRPTVDFLQHECGGGETTSWKRVIVTYPNVFSHSLEKTLLPKVDYLCNKMSEKSLGLKRSELSQVVAKFPPTLWLSESNLQSKLDFISESLDLTDRDLRTIVVSYPQILGLSLERNLRPKIEFFLQPDDERSRSFTQEIPINCGLTKSQLKEFVMYQPALLAYVSAYIHHSPSCTPYCPPLMFQLIKYSVIFVLCKPEPRESSQTAHISDAREEHLVLLLS